MKLKKSLVFCWILETDQSYDITGPPAYAFQAHEFNNPKKRVHQPPVGKFFKAFLLYLCYVYLNIV